MESRFNHIILSLERKTSTHPHLSKLWKNYLEIKKRRFLQYCSQCENVMERMTREPDVPPEMLLTMLIFHQVSDLNQQ